jgi:hypothetical protein
MANVTNQSGIENLKGSLRHMKEERFKVGFGDDLRLAVSNDMMNTMMSDSDARADLNMWCAPGDHKWRGIPTHIDHRLDADDAPEFEFSKVWTAKNERIWEDRAYRPLLSSVLPTDKEPTRGKND